MSFPARFQKSVLAFPYNLADLVPTVLDIAGCDVPDGLDGVSLFPSLSKGKADDTAPAFTFCQRLYGHGQKRGDFDEGQYMIADREWKYIVYSDGNELLFDLRNDPGEEVNVASKPEFEDIRSSLRRKIEEWVDKDNMPPAGCRGAATLKRIEASVSG